MRYALTFDEVIDGVRVPAGTQIDATATNAATLDGLEQISRATRVYDTRGLRPGAGDIGTALLDQLARFSPRQINVLPAVVPAGKDAGTPLARVRVPGSGGVTLIDDAGGAFALSGNFLVQGATALVVGQPYRVTLQHNSVNREFVLLAVSSADYLAAIGVGPWSDANFWRDEAFWSDGQ